METPPHPGSEEALALGCLCPIIDNHWGRGINCNYEMFVITAECPIHNPKEEKPCQPAR
jgi:hypothetical protein